MLLRPEDVVLKMKRSRTPCWIIDTLPDGRDFDQAMPVYKTKREAMFWATNFYVSHRARHGLGWDAMIDLAFFPQYAAIRAVTLERAAKAVSYAEAA